MPAGNARMQLIIAELRSMADGRATQIYERQLAAAARPFAPRVRAAILNIPVKGLVPYKQPPGLRIRIARCVVAWGEINGNFVSVGLKIQPDRMPPGQYSLPLGMEGVKRWRHPLFGDIRRWYNQGNAPHPYFYNNVGPLGPASARAMDRATDQIARAISG